VRTSAETVNKFKQAYEELKGKNLLRGSARLAKVRESAMLRLEGEGFPSRKNEDWRYTNPGSLLQHDQLSGLESPRQGLKPDDLAKRNPLALATSYRVVLVNGWVQKELCRLPGGEGFHLYSLASLVAGQGPAEILDRVEATWKAQEEAYGQAFSWLNSAMSLDGCVLVVDANQVVDRPIEVVHLGDGDSASRRISMARNFYFVGSRSKVTIIEGFYSSAATTNLTNSVSDLCLGAGARAHFLKPQFESTTGCHVSVLRAVLETEAELRFLQMASGSSVARQEFRCDLRGENAMVRSDAVFLVEGAEHLDLRTEIRHQAPRGQSHQLFKGIAGDSGRAVFNGKIVIEKGAQKVDSSQLCRTLLLSNSAEVDAKPELEIFADDVKATHGATVGQLDEEQIFYLLSRGVPRAQAETLLAQGFLAEVLEHYQDAGSAIAQMNELISGWIARARTPKQSSNAGAGGRA